VDGDQLLLSLENHGYLVIPAVRCVVAAFGGNKPFQADVLNPFKTSDEFQVGPPKLALRFPADFREDAHLRPGVEHWVTWYDTTDDAQAVPAWTGVEHRLAAYRFRTVL
jgi:hypothetical protein